MSHLIEIRNLKKIYAQGEEPVHALDGVSIDIDEGEFVAIMGASGSGKSTMLNILGCLDTPTSGSYRLDGLEVAARSRKELAIIRNKKLGFVFQNFNLLPRTSAIEQVELPDLYMGRLTRRERRERALMLLKRVGLGGRGTHKPSELSNEGITIVMVTHEDDIAAYAKRHIVMRDGKVMTDDKADGGKRKTTEEVAELVRKALA